MGNVGQPSGVGVRSAGLPLQWAQRIRGRRMRELERIFRSSHLSFLNCLELLECLVNTMRLAAFSETQHFANYVRSVVG